MTRSKSAISTTSLRRKATRSSFLRSSRLAPQLTSIMQGRSKRGALPFWRASSRRRCAERGQHVGWSSEGSCRQRTSRQGPLAAIAFTADRLLPERSFAATRQSPGSAPHSQGIFETFQGAHHDSDPGEPPAATCREWACRVARGRPRAGGRGFLVPAFCWTRGTTGWHRLPIVVLVRKRASHRSSR